MAQIVKNLPAMQEMKVQSPDWEKFFFKNAKYREEYEVKGESYFLSSVTCLPRGNHYEQPFYYAHMNICEASQVVPG